MGVGLRREHMLELKTYAQSPEIKTPIQFLEVVSENYFPQTAGWGDPALHTLDVLRERFPLILHGTALGLGNALPIDIDYLAALKRLNARYAPAFISDHLCWGQASHAHLGAHSLHDLLPLPYQRQLLPHLIQRVSQVQETLGRRICIENVSAYIGFNVSDMSEAEFLSALAKQADCWILLDINNVYVNAVNQHFDARAYLRQLPWDRVAYVHMAGHHHHGKWIIDTHDQAVSEDVWELYRFALRQSDGSLNTCLEWDANIPSLSVLEETLDRAQAYQQHHQETIRVQNLVSPLPELVHWQACFAQIMCDPRGVAHALKQHPEALHWFSGETEEIAARLSVYAEGYFWRLQDNLKRLYPRVCQLLSEDEWLSLCAQYYHKHPPTGPCIQTAGAHLPMYLTNHPLTEHPYLAALAQLEQDLLEVLHCDFSADVPLSAEEISQCTPDEKTDLQALFTPLRLFQVPWSFAFSAIFSPDTAPTTFKKESQQGVIYKTPQGLRVSFLTPLDFAFLHLCLRLRLSEACEKILQQFDTISESHIEHMLHHWHETQLIRGFKPLKERTTYVLPSHLA